MKQKSDIEELIVKYFNNECSLEEKAELLSALEENPEYKEEFVKYKQVSDTVFQALNKTEFDHQEAYQEFKKRNFETSRPSKIIVLSRWIAAAAAVILFVWFLTKPVPEIKIQTVVSEIQDLQLPDGSKISLNENSQVKYPKKFKKNERLIAFAGEGYFEIEPDPQKPFIIEMDKIRIEVIGTTFDILQDEKSGFIKVIVNSGVVKIINKINQSEIKVQKGEKAEYNYGTQKLNLVQNQELNYNSWKTGILIFRNTPLKKVIEDLKKYYKVDIEIENEAILNCPLDTKIDNIDFKDVVEMLELIFNFKIEKTNGKYFISGEGC